MEASTKLMLEAIDTHAEACQDHCPHDEALNDTDVIEYLHDVMDSYALNALEVCHEHNTFDPHEVGRAMAMNALRAGIHIGYRLYQLEMTRTAVADAIAKLEPPTNDAPTNATNDGGIPGKECGA